VSCGTTVATASTPASDLLATADPIADLPHGIVALTTTRQTGTLGVTSSEPVQEIMDRWTALQEALETRGITRLASAVQVHGAVVSRHDAGWHGWLRQRGVDGHLTTVPGTALAVTIADCTPVLVAHPRGAIAALHAGWRGTAAQILGVGLDLLAQLGYPADECAVHLGPAICGPCYEVGAEVLTAITGRPASGKGQLDVRAVLAEQAMGRGVTRLTTSEWCTRCHNDRFFSHRAGDSGRQIGLIALSSP
jgi:polyphenol oxidase